MSLHNPAQLDPSLVGPNHKLLSTDDLDKPLPEGAEYWDDTHRRWETVYRTGIEKPHKFFTYRIPLMLSDRLRSERDRLDKQIRVVEAVEKGAEFECQGISGEWCQPMDQSIETLGNLINGGNTVRLKPAEPTPQSIPWTLEGTEAEVCADIAERQKIGMAKYGVSVADNPLTLLEWLWHSYHEKLDDVIYMKRAITELERNGDPAGQKVTV